MAQKYKTQIILNNLYNLEDFSLMLYFLQSYFFRFAFGPEQLIKSPNRVRWTQSFGKLLIHPPALCPFYSFINVVVTYFMITTKNKLLFIKEASINRLLMFDWLNYQLWRVRMRILFSKFTMVFGVL